MHDAIKRLDLAVHRKENKGALAAFLRTVELPLTKGRIRDALHRRDVYWFGRRDSFRKNSRRWDDYITYFTAYGRDSDTPAGAIRSALTWLKAYRSAHAQHIMAKKAAAQGQSIVFTPVHLDYENSVEDLDWSLIVPFLQAVNPSRTSFDVADLSRVDVYRHNLYGLQKFVYSLFSGDDSVHQSKDHDNREFDHAMGEYPFFETLDDFIDFLILAA